MAKRQATRGQGASESARLQATTRIAILVRCTATWSLPEVYAMARAFREKMSCLLLPPRAPVLRVAQPAPRLLVMNQRP